MTSCGWLTSKEEKTQELVKQQLMAIDFDQINSYPLFENCDETLTLDGQRACFESELLSNCAKILSQYDFVIAAEVDKTVYVDFIIDKNAKVSVVHIEKDESIDEQMPEFNQLITQGLEELSLLGPALKEDIPVQTKYRIPIVLNTSE